MEEKLYKLQLWDAMFIPTKSRKAMKGYSRAKEDFREKIILKYKKYLMKEINFIYWPDCSKCHFVRPHLEKWCKENGYNFVAMQYWETEMELTSIPVAIVNNWDKTEIIDYDWILQLITNKDG